jgi:NADPH2 dehydrogenase
MATHYPKIAQLKTLDALRQRLTDLGLELPTDERILTAEQGSPLASPLQIGSSTVGNRWCIHPMEGWDGNRDGTPSEHTLRRWRNFGISGAKMIWGGEAAAVQPDGRANPNQIMALPETRHGLQQLLDELLAAHRQRFGHADDLMVGLQLTHSGRFSRPESKHLQPRIAYHHPLLDAKFGIEPNDASLVWTDDDLHRLVDSYVSAAGVARQCGFHFVDVKACHGYLLHEFLSARTRPGPFGGDLAGRTRLLRTIIERIHADVPGLMIGVRLSVFDVPPYQTSREVGQPMDYSGLLPYRFGFGTNAAEPLEYDLQEPLQLIDMLRGLGVVAVNLSCGSPYYNPHIQRPAIFPPSDGYQPPEDPLVGVARQIHAARRCKQAFADFPMVGTAYTYLQDYLPHVAQAIVRAGWIDLVGLGRMVLSYPQLPADCLETGQLERKRVCRTFSDCTTAPRGGLVSGCYPLDEYYKQLPEADALKELKQQIKQS